MRDNKSRNFSTMSITNGKKSKTVKRLILLLKMIFKLVWANTTENFQVVPVSPTNETQHQDRESEVSPIKTLSVRFDKIFGNVFGIKVVQNQQHRSL